MNTPEKNFWNKVKIHFPGHVQRLESAITLGVPDVNVCWQGAEYWIELKAWTPSVGILIRKEQWAWANRRIASGGKCFVLCHDEKLGITRCAKTDTLTVMSYDSKNKYVKVINPAGMATNIDKHELGNFLKTNLFT